MNLYDWKWVIIMGNLNAVSLLLVVWLFHLFYNVNTEDVFVMSLIIAFFVCSLNIFSAVKIKKIYDYYKQLDEDKNGLE